MNTLANITSALAILSLAACNGVAPATENLELTEGPPIEDIVTPMDEALSCLKGRIATSLTFGVGAIPDKTGRESFQDGGTGKFVSQGAGDIIQSALFKTGVKLINRRDFGVPLVEAQWGIRDMKLQQPVHLYVSGSINSLDFIPGGGATLAIGGVGPRYRQNRILVGLDMSITNTSNGQVLANIPLQKQIFADEIGVTSYRFFGTTLVDFDAGNQQREAMNFALRQMLYLATFELLTQLMPAEKYVECAVLVEDSVGKVSGSQTSADQLRAYEDQVAEEQLIASRKNSAEQAPTTPATQGDIPLEPQEGASIEPAILNDEADVVENAQAAAPGVDPGADAAELTAGSFCKDGTGTAVAGMACGDASLGAAPVSASDFGAPAVGQVEPETEGSRAREAALSPSNG
jgi:curli biogenesis system outer membrane secretion channel CsgG